MDKFDVTEIKVGDYVETRGGKVGYVTGICTNKPVVRFYWSGGCAYGGKTLTEQDFKQIGTYKFDDEFYSTEIIRKLEPYRGSDLSQDKVNAIIVKKLNEVIDKLNETE